MLRKTHYPIWWTVPVLQGKGPNYEEVVEQWGRVEEADEDEDQDTTRRRLWRDEEKIWRDGGG